MRINFKDIILFENDDFIVINKPPYISSLDERQADNSQSILRLAKEYSDDAQLAHRLDKETSGILAIAKNPAAYRHLSMQFEQWRFLLVNHLYLFLKLGNKSGQN